METPNQVRDRFSYGSDKYRIASSVDYKKKTAQSESKTSFFRAIKTVPVTWRQPGVGMIETMLKSVFTSGIDKQRSY